MSVYYVPPVPEDADQHTQVAAETSYLAQRGATAADMRRVYGSQFDENPHTATGKQAEDLYRDGEGPLYPARLSMLD